MTNRVLVVEDEVLVGLDIVALLEEAGFATEYAATEVEALSRIQSGRWDVAVADANLNGRSIERVARTLQESSIPFVIVTGYERSNLPAVLADVPLISKPFSHRLLVETVKGLCE